MLDNSSLGSAAHAARHPTSLGRQLYAAAAGWVVACATRLHAPGWLFGFVVPDRARHVLVLLLVACAQVEARWQVRWMQGAFVESVGATAKFQTKGVVCLSMCSSTRTCALLLPAIICGVAVGGDEQACWTLDGGQLGQQHQGQHN